MGCTMYRQGGFLELNAQMTLDLFSYNRAETGSKLCICMLLVMSCLHIYTIRLKMLNCVYTLNSLIRMYIFAIVNSI